MARLSDEIAPEDLVVWRSAKRIIRRRGPAALYLAKDASGALAFEGDEKGARAWRKTSQAIEWLLAHPESMDLIDSAT